MTLRYNEFCPNSQIAFLLWPGNPRCFRTASSRLYPEIASSNLRFEKRKGILSCSRSIPPSARRP